MLPYFDAITISFTLYPSSSLASVTTSQHNKLAGLDHLRALAIILVFVFHYRLFHHPAWIDTVCKFGWTGVDLFFVLSGYLISSQLFSKIASGNGISLKEFYLKRFFRIIPAYLTVVAIYFCIPFFREWEALPPLYKFLTFTQNLGLDIRTCRTFSHAWSLCIEEQFYLLLPLILIVQARMDFLKPKWLLLPVLFVFGFIARVYSWQHFVAPLQGEDGFGVAWYKYIYYPTYCRLDGLLAGITIAALNQFVPGVKARISKHGTSLFFTSLIILVTAYFICLDEHSFIASVFGFTIVAIGYSCMVAAAVSPSCFLYRSRSAITAFIARLSFSAYLTHKGLIHIAQVLFERLGVAADSTLLFLLCIACALAGAFLLHIIIERPFLQLRSKVLQSQKVKTSIATVLLLVGFVISSLPLSAQTYYLFIGSYNFNKEKEGIYVYQFDTISGNLKKISATHDVANPSYLTISPNGKYVYACTESLTAGAGSVSSFSFDHTTGALSFINSQKSGGENPVYISTDKNSRWLINANYTEGSISAYRLSNDGSIDPASQVIPFAEGSINKDRQGRAHTHSAVFSPDEDCVFFPDLGADKIRCYSFGTELMQPLSAAKYAFTKTVPGSGPRHFTFHPNKKYAYCIEELGGAVTAYRYGDGKLDSIQRIMAHEGNDDGDYSSADIHISPDGRFLYASNRGKENNIAIFSIEPQKGFLKLIGYQSTLGNHPRNFTIDPTGKFLLVANQVSGSVIVFKRDQQTGLLTKTGMKIKVRNPSCLQIRRYDD